MSGTDAPVRTGSLRRRVVLSVLALLLVALGALGLSVNYLLGQRLHGDLRSRLIDRAYHAQALADQDVSGHALADAVTGDGILALYRSSSGVTYVGEQQPPPPGAPHRPGPPPVDRTAGTPTVTTGAHDSLQVALDVAGGQVVLQTSQADVDRTLAELRTIELIAGATVLGLSALVLLGAVRVALAPLNRMTALARRIRDGERGRRLRPTRPRTELGRTAGAFDDMLDALERAERQARDAEARMRQFLADASHDLRTPLAGVIAGAETLLRTPAPRAQREQQLVGLIREARRAARLVEDLLLMARIDAADQPVIRADVELAELATRCVEAVRLRRPDLCVVLRADAVTVRGDADQLARAVGNLLDNAATVTPPGGHVDVEVAGSGGVATVRVRDSGPGVPVADRQRIFDRSVRLDPSRSGSGTAGAGLGLPIARAVARRHGGALRCVDALSGACFELTLPGRPAPVAEHDPGATLSPMVG